VGSKVGCEGGCAEEERRSARGPGTNKTMASRVARLGIYCFDRKLPVDGMHVPGDDCERITESVVSRVVASFC
jgi:hypothetical protein